MHHSSFNKGGHRSRHFNNSTRRRQNRSLLLAASLACRLAIDSPPAEGSGTVQNMTGRDRIPDKNVSRETFLSDWGRKPYKRSYDRWREMCKIARKYATPLVWGMGECAASGNA
jgi:hypothetical protein